MARVKRERRTRGCDEHESVCQPSRLHSSNHRVECFVGMGRSICSQRGRSTMTGQNAPPRVGAVRRRPVSLQAEALTRRTIWPTFGDSLCVIEADAYGLRLADWTMGRSEELRELATRHGAVLLRGFLLADVQDFEKCVENLCGGALEYRFRASPRTEIGRNIYTATDYPADQTIFPHNEHAYSPLFPN